MVGLEFRVRFRRVRVTPNGKLGGDVVELRGRIRNQKGQTTLGRRVGSW